MFFSSLEQFDSVNLFSFFFLGFGFSFNSILLPLVLINIFFYIFIFFNSNIYKLIPGFWQFLLENLFIFVFNIIDQQIGKKGYIYLPFIFSLFTFILFADLISMTSFGLAVTSFIIILCHILVYIIPQFVLGLLFLSLNMWLIFWILNVCFFIIRDWCCFFTSIRFYSINLYLFSLLKIIIILIYEKLL